MRGTLTGSFNSPETIGWGRKMSDFVASNGVGVRYRENGDIEVTTVFGWALALPENAASAVVEFLKSETHPYPQYEPHSEHEYTGVIHNPRDGK